MKPLLVSFGDSWTFGSELDQPQEQSWIVRLSERTGYGHVNMGVPASSIGHLTVQLFDFINQTYYNGYKKIFLVGLSGFTRYLAYSNQHKEFINITPEANYRTNTVNKNGRPPDVLHDLNVLSSEMYKRVQHPNYDTFLAVQTISLFQNYCRAHNIDCYVFSYFDEFNFYGYENILDMSCIHPETITKSLTGREYSQGVMNHECFAGKLFHPSEYGHTQIANLLYDNYISRL